MSQDDLSALSASMPSASEYKRCALDGIQALKTNDLLMIVTLHSLKGAPA